MLPRREIFRFDRAIQLQPRTCEILFTTECMLCNVSTDTAAVATMFSPTSLDESAKSILQSAMRHRLSSELEKISPWRPYTQPRWPDEKQGLQQGSSRLMWEHRAGSGAGILRAASVALGLTGGFRQGGMKIASEECEIQMPDPRTAAAAVAELPHAIDCSHPSPIVRAAAALLLVVNAHLLPDGNGRAGRVLANFYLQLSGMPGDAYIPFYEIGRISRGGYEIALRRAELHGVWDDLICFFCAAIRSSTTASKRWCAYG
jgi:hypothetical protein